MDRSRKLANGLRSISLIPIVSRLGIRRHARGRRTIVSNFSLPCFLEQERGDAPAVFGSDDAPEGGAVALIGLAETIFVDVGEMGVGGGDVTVETEG